MPLAFLACVLAVSSGADVLYESDTTALPVAGLSLAGAEYAIDDGWLTVQSEKSNPYLRLDATACGAYRLEVNNQFVGLRLVCRIGDEWTVVDEAPSYQLYPHNTQEFELRLAWVGDHVYGFIDDKLLVEYDDPAPPAPGGDFAMLSGWSTDCAWRDVSLADEADLSEWPRAAIPDPSTDLVEVTWVRGLRDDQVYFDGEAAGLTFRLKNQADEPRTIYLGMDVINVWDREVDSKRKRIDLAASEERELTVEYEPRRRGCFKVALRAGTSENDLAWLEDLGSFTVVSRELYDRPRNPDSYFGGHMDGINLQWHLEAGRKIGIQRARCHNMMQWTWWTRIQPSGPDEWIWFDDAQKLNDDLGFETMGQFLCVPDWASTWAEGDPGPARAYAPKDWDAFRKYVRETVGHYKGSIGMWEVWNEPHVSVFWRGTPEEYAELLKICYEEAKAVDPECIIMGGGGPTVRQHDWIERMLAAGGGPYMDGFTIHYLEADIARDRMPKLRKLLADHGIAGQIYNSEENVFSTSFLDQCRADHIEPEARYHCRNACYELVRRYMENIAAGVTCIFNYDQADPWRFKGFDKPRVESERGPISGAMWDEGRSYRPMAAAHAALASAIEGKQYKGRIDSGDMRVFLFADDSTATAVQYAEFESFARREELRLPIPEGATAESFTITDIMGNESAPETDGGEIVLLKAREPVFVACEGEEALGNLRALYADVVLR